ncbi:MAG: hypothetical protein Q8N98_03325, partial [bacterium]|nr:hypothetical protein [bacterium]
RYRRLLGFVVFWLFFGAVPSAFTHEPPSSVRLLVISPALTVFSAAGFYWLIVLLKSSKWKPIFIIILAGIIFNVSYVFHQYTVHFPRWQPWFRDGGAKEMVAKVGELEKNYRYVVLPQDPYIFFLFYNKILPSEFLSKAILSPEAVGRWERVEKLKKIIFKMPYNCPKIGELNVLYICRGAEIPQNSRLLHFIRYKDNVPAFSFIEFFPASKIPSPKPKLPQGLNYMVEVGTVDDELLREKEGRLW